MFSLIVGSLSLSLYIYIYIDSAYKKLTAGVGGAHDLSLVEEGGIQLSSLGGDKASPLWVQDVQAVEDVLVHIQQEMTDLQSMHATRLGSVFGKDLENMEGRIEKKTRELTDQFRYAERLLQKVGMATRRGDDAAIGANVQRRCVPVTSLLLMMGFILSLVSLILRMSSPFHYDDWLQPRKAVTGDVTYFSTITTQVLGGSANAKVRRFDCGRRYKIWNSLGATRRGVLQHATTCRRR